MLAMQSSHNNTSSYLITYKHSKQTMPIYQYQNQTMSNFPLSIEFASNKAHPSFRLLHSTMDISWEASLQEYRQEAEQEQHPLRMRVKRLLSTRCPQKTDMVSSYCQECNDDEYPTTSTMKEEEVEDCQSTLFGSSDFDTPSGYSSQPLQCIPISPSTPSHWPTLEEVSGDTNTDDVLPIPTPTPISHKVLLQKKESTMYNERGLDDFVVKLRHREPDRRRVVRIARCA